MLDIDLNEINKINQKEQIIFAIENGKNSKTQSVFLELHPVDQAQIISNIDPELRIKLIGAICNIELKN